MSVIRLKYVQSFKDDGGTQRHYFRRAGCPRVALPGLPGSAEFMAAYQAALSGKPSPIGARNTKDGTISALVLAWYTSRDFKHLKPSTQATYRGIAERFRKKHGEKRVATLEARHIEGILDARADTPAAANNLLRIIRLLLAFAVARGWRKDNPARDVKKTRMKVKGFHSWTEEEISAFEVKWPLGTRERLALALLLFTAQRRSDVVGMGPQHVKDGRIEVVQMKTGARLSIPMHPDLKAAMEACPSGNLAFLTTRVGGPFTKESFTNWFRLAAKDAGLPDGCTPHGLRKAAARRLAEAGCSVHEIGAITGHRTLQEIANYTRAADQKRLADEAFARIGVARTART